ncbi:hypothetical protein ACFY0A_45015 [Streptomyces sp. NPDC001698]|uniref:hypothetical protein n=1 Tax=Streptomyces sp. NPDC001698 TaxID=3364601 RepID=UPI00368C1466
MLPSGLQVGDEDDRAEDGGRVSSILTKLGLANSAEDHRRVPAVLLYLNRP